MGGLGLFCWMPPHKPKKKGTAPAPINRDDWKRRLYERNPEIQKLKQSVHPLERFQTFVEIYEPGREQTKQQLPHETIIKLIIQHLTFFGFYESRELLTKESGIDFEQDDMEDFKHSQLLHFIREAFRDSEQIYSLTLEPPNEDDKENCDLEDLLCSLELIEAEQLGSASENINIWNEPEEGTLSYDNENQIKYATFNKLVELISSNNTEMSLVQMFLVTYQSFATPELLFSKLLERFNVPDRIPQSEAMVIRVKVGNVLRKWIENCFDDFSPELVSRLNQFIKEIQYNENKTIASLSKSICNAIAKAEKKKDSESKVRQFNKTTPAPKINMKTIFDPQLDIFSISEEEIARQLCIIEFRIFSKIRPSELLNQSWSKPKYKHRAMNILRLINRFNTVSMWVATSILKVPGVRARGKLMGKFIKIAEHLLHTLHNFNATMAILAGLSWSSVHRLAWTRKELPPNTQKALEEIERILSSDRSFQTYRPHIAECNPPCIPYLGVYLTDLTFIDENPDTVNGMINFTKRRLVYSVISKIQQYQQTHYNLQPVDQIIQQLLHVSILDETSLYNLSLKREPRKAERSEIQN